MLGPFLEILIGGLLTGVLYSLVALGFVLIFKASGVFNFAQGAMVLFAALTLARLTGEIDGREVHLANFVVAAGDPRHRARLHRLVRLARVRGARRRACRRAPHGHPGRGRRA